MPETEFPAIDPNKLPAGLTVEMTERLRDLSAELRGLNLNVVLSVSDSEDRHTSIIAGDALVLLPVLLDLARRLQTNIMQAGGRVECQCPKCEAQRQARQPKVQA